MFEALEERLKKILDSPVDQAHDALNDTLVKLAPLLRDVSNRIGGIAHGLLDRFTINIEIKLNPIEKGKPPIT